MSQLVVVRASYFIKIVSIFIFLKTEVTRRTEIFLSIGMNDIFHWLITYGSLIQNERRIDYILW